MRTERLKEILTAYADNYDKQNALNEKIFEVQNEREWKGFYTARAGELARLFEENAALLAEEEELLQEPVTEETAEELYAAAWELLRRHCLEIGVLAPLLRILIGFYEGSEEWERLTRLYEAAVMSLSLAPSAAPYLPCSEREYMEKIFALRDHYAQMPTWRARLVFWEMYADYTRTMLAPGALDVGACYQHFRDMTALWGSDAVQELDGESEDMRFFVDKATSFFIDVLISAGLDTDPEIREAVTDYAEKQFREQQAACEAVYQYDCNIYLNYIQARLLRGEITPREAMELAFGYYKEIVGHLGESQVGEQNLIKYGDLSEQESFVLLCVPRRLAEWAAECGMEALPGEMLETLMDVTRNILFEKLSSATVFENNMNDLLADYCFKLAPYLPGREEKEKWFFQLIIRRQLPTYIHCTMVKKLAVTIFKEMYRDRPDIFADVRGVMDEGELLGFLENCAMFHDVGKNRIAGIINIQTRKIGDGEFDMIRRHPRLGCDLILEDPDFACYRDVILGHHKFYGGQGGYPGDFDNTKSPYRSVIDLITLCDCMDAATDVLGRNYKHAKTCDEVIGEFERDKGSRYNPDMVDYIRDSASLREKLGKLVSDERIHIAYDIYREAVE